MASRLATALLGLLVSLVVTAAAWWYLGTPAVFLVLPFVPFLLGRGDDDPSERTCPECGYTTAREDHDYCPRDGTRLR